MAVVLLSSLFICHCLFKGYHVCVIDCGSSQVDARLLDMYLGSSSPAYGPGLLVEPVPGHPRKPMGTKQFAPDFSRMFALVAVLVRARRCTSAVLAQRCRQPLAHTVAPAKRHRTHSLHKMLALL